MLKKSIKITYLILAAFLFTSGIAELKAQKLTDNLPIDPAVTIGKLDNGMVYYIRENKKPENRLELRLVVKAGAILEDDDQNGLAHFSEHMLFNGTEHFPKDKLVKFLESTGMKFGADVNAGTSYDYTSYMLQLPADNQDLINNGFQVLEDWAHNASFDNDEIDKERGVIIEEWRVRSGASKRLQNQHFPVLMEGSKYVIRDVIGDTNIIRNFKYDVIKRFYTDWYRPDLMAVVAIGDFDKKDIEKKIKEQFGKIQNPSNPRERTIYTIPNHKNTKASVAKDKEMPYAQFMAYFKKDQTEQKTYGSYRDKLVGSLYDRMFNNRLQEMRNQAPPPFIQAAGGFGRFLGDKNIYFLMGVLNPQKINTGIEAVLTEAFRVKQHGFTETELAREKEAMLKMIEKIYNEKDKTPSKSYTQEYTNNFLEDESIPGIEVEYQLYKKYIPEITLKEINALADERITKENTVLTLSLPDKAEISAPSEKELLAMFDAMFYKKLDAYEDKVADEPLMEKAPAPGKIKSSKTYDKIGVTELTFENGVKVVLKPTDFKNDEIRFTAFSPGGHSLAGNADYISASMADGIVDQSGIDGFDYNTLSKMLKGKLVSVSPYIGELEEGMNGSSTPEDMQTMFELIYLYFTAPRFDVDAFNSYVDKTKSAIENRNLNPTNAFRDTISATLSDYHFRARPLSVDVLNELNHKKAFEFYKDRFADADDFTFVFVGNFDVEKIKPMLASYIGSLPTSGRTENWKDVGMDVPNGKIDKKVNKGIMDKSTVRLVFSGDFDWSREERFKLRSLVNIMNIILRENVREEKSGTYGVSIFPRIERYPDGEYQIHIHFGCEPKRVDELIETALTEINKVRKAPPAKEYLDKVKEQDRRSYETNLKENSFWLGSLAYYYENNLSPELILTTPEMIESLTLEDIHQAAKKYFNMDNYIRVVLYPEE